MEIPTRFWKEWSAKDFFERREFIKKRLVKGALREFVSAPQGMPRDMAETLVAGYLNDYFSDLREYLLFDQKTVATTTKHKKVKE
jgi:hypothetical protein